MSAFFDTNVLVYALANNESKREAAQAVLARGGVISVQVLNELANVLRTKQREQWPRIEAALIVVERGFETTLPVTLGMHRAALALARDHGLGIYDALIIAAALEADCDTLYSEDLQHGRRFGDCVIVDPFLESEA